MDHGHGISLRRKQERRPEAVKTLKLRKTQSSIEQRGVAGRRRAHTGEGGCSPVMLFPSSPSKIAAGITHQDEDLINIPTLPLCMQTMMSARPILPKKPKPPTLSIPLLDSLEHITPDHSQHSFESERETAVDHLKDLIRFIRTLKHPLVRDVKEHVTNGTISLPSDVLSMLKCRPRLGLPSLQCPSAVSPLPPCLAPLILPQFQLAAGVRTSLPKACPCCAAGNSPSCAPSPSVMSTSSLMSTLSNSSSDAE
eukprot:TRINITY_DN44_c4_g1_i1.p1 TRINITY_DN44_c4_g1~~TRINITY_DN44_c4_g1_i1.p1  ORF type:complete len:253 (+),score=32.75 TRINITY_DN44_c4_g1_i1:57-815(+)